MRKEAPVKEIAPLHSTVRPEPKYGYIKNLFVMYKHMYRSLHKFTAPG